MEDTVLQRIRSIIDYLNISDRKFAESIGLPQTTISSMFKRGNDPNVNIIQATTNAYAFISLDWLITGKGEMLKPVTSPAPGSIAIGGNASGIVNSGSVTGSIHGHSVKNGNVVGDNNNIGIMPSDCERALVKAKAEIDILKKKVKESETKIKNIEAQSKNRIEEITRQHNQEKESLKNQLEQAIEERDRSLVDKDRALAMLEKALSK